MIEYRVNPIRSLYIVFQKAKAYFNILNTKAQMQKKLKLKSGYKVFKFFQATAAFEQNLQLRLYKTAPQKAQFY